MISFSQQVFLAQDNRSSAYVHDGYGKVKADVGYLFTSFLQLQDLPTKDVLLPVVNHGL